MKELRKPTSEHDTREGLPVRMQAAKVCERVAVVGTGTMGTRIAMRLLLAGYTVTAWNRTEARLSPLIEAGCFKADSPFLAASEADIVIAMVSDPKALEAVTIGENGLFQGMHAGSLLCVMSTVGPTAVRDLARRAPQGVFLVDAPVLGSTAEAEKGELLIFAGGSQEAVRRVNPLLAHLGRVFETGAFGSASAAKLVANGALFGVVGLVGESVALAEELGLDRAMAFEVLSFTPLSLQAQKRRSAIEASAFPCRFRLALGRKDADLIAMETGSGGQSLPLLTAARSWLQLAEASGLGESDYTAMLGPIIGLSPRIDDTGADESGSFGG